MIKLSPTRTTIKSRYDSNLEGLRGLAALLVLYCHLLAPNPVLDPAYAPSGIFWWFEIGQGAVLVFFIISGYVIGLTNQRAWSAAAAGGYLWRRALRLVPLYVLAILAAYWAWPVDSARTVVGNLFFLQNESVPHGIPLMVANTNLWSLNYEVLYYGLFLLVWYLDVSLWYWVLPALALAVVGFFKPSIVPVWLGSYGMGWIFWLAGYWLSRQKVGSEAEQAVPWPSLLLLLFATRKLLGFFMILIRLNLPLEGSLAVSLLYVDFLPIALVLVAAVTGRRFKGYRWLQLACLGYLLVVCAWRLARGTFFANPSLVPLEYLVGLAALLWGWRPSRSAFGWLAPVGLVSYGIYIFAPSVQWLLRFHLKAMTGTALTFALRAILAVVLTIAVGWLAERVLQPRIRRALARPSDRPASPPASP